MTNSNAAVSIENTEPVSVVLTEAAVAAVDISVARDKVWQNRQAMCEFLTERDDAIDMTWIAITAGLHTFLMGPPGTAKSLLSRCAVECIESSSRYVERLLHKAMTPDELFGAIDLARFQKDAVYRRNLTGGIADAEFVFLDEVWKGNTLSLNSLLAVLNERIYTEQGIVHELPLLSCFSASNEFPQDDSLAALYDRFLLRDICDYIQNPDAWEQLVFDKANGRRLSFTAPAVLTLEELAAIRADVARVSMSRAMVKKFRELKVQLSNEGIVISDRRAPAATEALKAAAWLDEETEISVDHFQALRFVLWDTPKEREQVQAALAGLERSATAKVIEEIDAALRSIASLPSDTAGRWDAIPVLLPKLQDVGNAVKERLAAGEFSKRGTEKVRRRVRELGTAFAGIKDEYANSIAGF